VALPEFSVAPVRWCFPVAGCVAYRGYFREASARAFARRLEDRGFDVIVGGVPAYSTLGRFADPVLNTMLGWGDNELAAIVFHELAHQVVYVPGDSQFNEAFATAVEQEGLRRWLALRGREGELETWERRRARQAQYLELFRERRAELGRLFDSGVPEGVMRERKQAIFTGLAQDMRALEQRHGARSPYAAWLAAGLNNAHLAALATYFDCVPGFERLLAAHEHDLPRFYDAVRELARVPREERRALLCATSGDRAEGAG
jgi:predicted aminopeptidase